MQDHQILNHQIEDLLNASSRRFVKVWFAAVALVVLIVFPGITLGLLNWFDDPSLRWIEEVRARKFRMAEQAGNGGRIVIAGGSSGLFGVDAELLEAKLGRPVVNVASHGGVGLPFLLRDARRAARKGDLLLLHLEYQHYRGSRGEVSDIERKYLWTYEPEQFLRLSPQVAVHQIYGNPFADYLHSWRSWNRRLRGESSEANPAVWTHYSFVGLGPRGDFRSDVRNPALVRVPKMAPITEVHAEAQRELRAFFRWCRQRDIHVAGVMPAAVRGGRDASDAPPAFEPVREFYQREGLSLLGDARLLQLPRELFFDTAYHANAAGRRLRTEALARESVLRSGTSRQRAERFIFLVHDPAIPFQRELAFAHNWWVDYRYLARQDLGHPWCVTPATLAEFAQEGVAVRYADPGIDKILQEAGCRVETEQRTTSSLNEWVAAFPRHVFLLATVGQVETHDSFDRLPEPFRGFLADRAPARAAILGTGPFARVKSIVHDGEIADAKQSANKRWQKDARFPLELRATGSLRLPYPAEHWPLIVERELIFEAGEAGLAVAVVDPELGIVVKRGLFCEGVHVEWELKRVVHAAGGTP